MKCSVTMTTKDADADDGVEPKTRDVLLAGDLDGEEILQFEDHLIGWQKSMLDYRWAVEQGQAPKPSADGVQKLRVLFNYGDGFTGSLTWNRLGQEGIDLVRGNLMSYMERLPAATRSKMRNPGN